MKYTIKTAKNLLHLSGERAKKKAQASCGLCGTEFLLYPWQDIPKHPCTKKKSTENPY